MLCYSNDFIKNNLSSSERKLKTFLISSFFEYENGSEIESSDVTQEAIKQLSLEEFYEKLRQEHENDDLESGVPQNVQHHALRPILRPYQQKGIKWMMKRENQIDFLPDLTKKIRSKFNTTQTFFYDQQTLVIHEHRPERQVVPSGGLLTDEMGLGKTVEVIGLMLMNPFSRAVKRKFNEVEPEAVDTPKINRTSSIRCICHETKTKSDLICCTKCSTRQHRSCVFKQQFTETDDVIYVCPFCWKSSKEIIDSKTTIIVTPTSIKHQWEQELQRQIADKSFKTYIYEGISTGWVSPTELVKFDAILTDFNTLSKELYFSDRVATSRSLRNEKKFEYPPSPLTSIRFYRVVLDEAQMVENKNNRPSQMVSQLPAIHRWGTTGTPVEKDSIRCLYGLIFFLGLDPFTDERLFGQLFQEYQLGNHENMIKILSKVMWRTCKKNVLSEINIPSQTEIIHSVEMTDLQNHFYGQVHQETKPLFMKNVHEYLKRNGVVEMVTKQNGTQTFTVRERVIDLSMKKRFLYQLNNATLKIFLEPLRRLRQDCTIPSVFHQSNDQSRIKHTLRPEQLHEHLVSTTSRETKSALRSICSSINGIAAFQMSQEKYNDASEMYKQVLKMAKDYVGFVSVDSMLQIHALNGLIDIAGISNINADQTLNYLADMGKLEWKYISSYYDKVKEFNEQANDHKQELRKSSRNFTDHKGFWWRDVVSIRGEEKDRLMEVISVECLSAVTDNTQVLQELRSDRGIQLLITEWSDKIEKYQKDVAKSFKCLDFIVHNLKPVNEMSTEDKEKLVKLSKAALNCHLNLSEDEENLPRKSLCDLCKLQLKLNELESVLFNVTIKDDEVSVKPKDGSRKVLQASSWNPRFEEKLLKSIHNFAKRRSMFEDEIAEMGSKHFKYLEALKTQFKIQSQLWVEVNYTISAFDELNMCKMRVQVCESPDEITEEEARFRLKIPRFEVEDQLKVLFDQKREAEMNFVRLNGKLKYLQHLKERNEPPLCPICDSQPRERYFVLTCGHSFCTECFHRLIKGKPRNIKCPVCRAHEDTRNIYAVTCNPESAMEPSINGSFSPKIDEIIRCILKLKETESDVKILIFSHWDKILETIANALNANDIKYRSSYSANFIKQIMEFKDYKQEVTCMMLNLKFGGKGLNLIEATHVFLVEPILNADEEMQAIGRVHRIGQTRETFVHRFITTKTIEDTIYKKVIQEKEKWTRKEFTINDLEELLNVEVGKSAVDLINEL